MKKLNKEEMLELYYASSCEVFREDLAFNEVTESVMVEFLLEAQAKGVVIAQPEFDIWVDYFNKKEGKYVEDNLTHISINLVDMELKKANKVSGLGEGPHILHSKSFPLNEENRKVYLDSVAGKV